MKQKIKQIGLAILQSLLAGLVFWLLLNGFIIGGDYLYSNTGINPAVVIVVFTAMFGLISIYYIRKQGK